MSLSEALGSDDNNVGKLKVVSLLESLPGVGKVKARKVMEEIGIADNRRVQGLGSQQREALLEVPRVSPAASGRSPLIIVVSGPGGVGKGTIVDALVGPRPAALAQPELDDPCPAAGRGRQRLRVHRPRRTSSSASPPAASWSGPSSSATTTARRCRSRIPSADVVLEIEVDGARQVKAARPDALLIFVLPPTRDEQERRLRGRGDAADKVVARLRKAEDEEPVGRALADHVVVNDDLEDTIDEMLAIIERGPGRSPLNRAAHR